MFRTPILAVGVVERIFWAAVKLSMLRIERIAGARVALLVLGRAGRRWEYRIASFEAVVLARMLGVRDLVCSASP
jgi:hypothetical protein